MNLRATASLSDLYRCRPFAAASGVVCAAMAALCTLPRDTQAAEDGVQINPNVVLASALSAASADDTEATRPRWAATPADREESTTFAATRWSSSAELSGGQYRWSASRGSLDVGMNFVMPAQDGRRVDLRADNAGPLVPTLPSLSVGFRRESHAATATTLLDRSTGSTRDASYVSKIGLEWKPPQSQVNFLREGLGIRLDGHDRMTVRLRKGVLGLYMQRKF